MCVINNNSDQNAPPIVAIARNNSRESAGDAWWICNFCAWYLPVDSIRMNETDSIRKCWRRRKGSLHSVLCCATCECVWPGLLRLAVILVGVSSRVNWGRSQSSSTSEDQADSVCDDPFDAATATARRLILYAKRCSFTGLFNATIINRVRRRHWR